MGERPPVESVAISSAAVDAVAVLRALIIHDVSPTIEAGMPMWFLYEGPRSEPVLDRATHGAAANRITLAEHTGSHVDAPFHFDGDGLTMDAVAPDALFLRPYKKFDVSADDPQPGELITLEALLAAGERDGVHVEAGDVAIIETGWDRYFPGGADEREPGWWGRNQPGLTAEACEHLAGAGIVAVASDTAACDVAARDGEILAGHGHGVYFLPRGILIVEGLRHLSRAPASGLLLALPLKIAGGTGSPVRVLLLAGDRAGGAR